MVCKGQCVWFVRDNLYKNVMVCMEVVFVVCKGQSVQEYYDLYGKSRWFVRDNLYKSFMVYMVVVCGL